MGKFTKKEVTMMEDKKIYKECTCDMTKHIKGIKCDVKNCVYHDCETYCTAKQIAVGPSSATSSADTACATFKERK